MAKSTNETSDGRKWLAGVHVDLEALGFAFGAADLPAACVGAPHRRQRLFWVADAGCTIEYFNDFVGYRPRLRTPGSAGDASRASDTCQAVAFRGDE